MLCYPAFNLLFSSILLSMLTYISNTSHNTEVLSRVQSVKQTLWIGTADIKDLYMEVGMV